jgi:hypothetical protein
VTIKGSCSIAADPDEDYSSAAQLPSVPRFLRFFQKTEEKIASFASSVVWTSCIPNSGKTGNLFVFIRGIGFISG